MNSFKISLRFKPKKHSIYKIKVPVDLLYFGKMHQRINYNHTNITKNKRKQKIAVQKYKKSL